MQRNWPGGSTQRAIRVTSRQDDTLNEWMKWKCEDFKCVWKPTESRLCLTHYVNKSSRWATLDTSWWQGKSIPRAGLGSSCPSAGPRSTARVRGSPLPRTCPSRHRPMDDHPCCHCVRRRSIRQDWRPGRPGSWRVYDFDVLSRWVIPAWRRQCPRESWHVARCLREIIVSVKLLYSHKTFWCWLPRKCVNPHGSFVKLCLLSNQRRNWHIGGWVKIKRYHQQAADQWRRYTKTRQVSPRSGLIPCLSPWIKLRESNFELVKFD